MPEDNERINPLEAFSPVLGLKMTETRALARAVSHRAEERDEARFVARRLWEFIQDGCFLDDLEMGEEFSPGWELWVKGHVVRECAARSPWLTEEKP